VLALIGDTLPACAVNDEQFVEVGQQERPPNGETPFTTLPDGVQIKDFRVGGGGSTTSGSSSAVVRVGSRVELTMKGRLLNLNGVIFYDTKENDPNGFGEGSPLVFTVGSNTVLPGLESGILGMSKGGIRRIIVPATVGYGSYPTLEPQPFSEMGKRALESVTKNPRRDQTVLFDVRVDRVR
jgi:FKBP-type peptidyl-prolyl cis-trans isomerase FkpA